MAVGVSVVHGARDRRRFVDLAWAVTATTPLGAAAPRTSAASTRRERLLPTARDAALASRDVHPWAASWGS
jgi:hypothetical protein